ncbi:hypothetical protein AVEN_247469-1 [Araneus ventricosus]|uniref:Uncharacterized protein n=1 Tax=Araneus ventricosus TaxID=182803 RepID=A0A4Y2J7F2_ARAVE|nr:hypothetical protein AVEN_247469-1 [Araneus ventricosus]
MVVYLPPVKVRTFCGKDQAVAVIATRTPSSALELSQRRSFDVTRTPIGMTGVNPSEPYPTLSFPKENRDSQPVIRVPLRVRELRVGMSDIRRHQDWEYANSKSIITVLIKLQDWEYANSKSVMAVLRRHQDWEYANSKIVIAVLRDIRTGSTRELKGNGCLKKKKTSGLGSTQTQEVGNACLKKTSGLRTQSQCAQLTSFLARTADEDLKSFPMDQHYYSSASNSLLARTADRTSKTFALQGDPSRSTPPSVIQALSLYSLPRRAVMSHGMY